MYLYEYNTHLALIFNGLIPLCHTGKVLVVQIGGNGNKFPTNVCRV